MIVMTAKTYVKLRKAGVIRDWVVVPCINDEVVFVHDGVEAWWNKDREEREAKLKRAK